MFQEHQFSIWGTDCVCGRPCGILQNQHHPWNETGFTVRLTCPACGRSVVIDQRKAADFYSRRITSFFGGLSGTVIDFGCGGGFLSRYLITRPKIDRVIGVDTDPGCLEELSDVGGEKFSFLTYDGSRLSELFAANSADYLVSRDVFMFLRDTEQYFQDVSRIVTKGIRQMGWYQSGNPRMKNRLFPPLICAAYRDSGWSAEETDLDWYPSGYFIAADKRKMHHDEKEAIK